MNNPTIAAVVFPARDFNESVAAWSTVFGTGPTFSSDGIEKAPGDADFAVFKSAETEIGLTSMPWVDEPLVLLSTDDIDASRQELIAAGAMPLGEIADGSLAVLGTAPITNGDPETGIVDPGFRLAVVKLADRQQGTAPSAAIQLMVIGQARGTTGEDSVSHARLPAAGSRSVRQALTATSIRPLAQAGSAPREGRDAATSPNDRDLPS